MKKLIFIASIVLITCCGSDSDNDRSIDIDGIWVTCTATPDPGIYAFSEVVYANGTVQNSTFGTRDNQCINIAATASIISNATLTLSNRHVSSSGLKAYDYTRSNVTVWDNGTQVTTPRPDWFSIVYRDGDRLYFGKITATQDASSAQRRPDEIDFTIFLTRQ